MPRSCDLSTVRIYILVIIYLERLELKVRNVHTYWKTQSSHPLTSLFPVFRLRSEKWMNVQVGDIIKLENNQFVTVSELVKNISSLCPFC